MDLPTIFIFGACTINNCMQCRKTVKISRATLHQNNKINKITSRYFAIVNSHEFCDCSQLFQLERRLILQTQRTNNSSIRNSKFLLHHAHNPVITKLHSIQERNAFAEPTRIGSGNLRAQTTHQTLDNSLYPQQLHTVRLLSLVAFFRSSQRLGVI